MQGRGLKKAEVLVRSCVTKSCREMTSAVQLAAGNKTTEERNENEYCLSGVMFVFTSVCLGICIKTFSRYNITPTCICLILE